MTPKRPGQAAAIPETVDRGPKVVVRKEPYAALDLGTNSCRMLIARADGNQVRIIDSFSKAVQLGAGLESSGTLSRLSIRRTVQALRVCQRKLDQHKVRKMRLVATEACRRARNGASFIAQVRRETGLELEVITPEEEARLAVVSCGPLVHTGADQLLVVDIGGGSTELVWIDLSDVAPERRSAAVLSLHGCSFADAGFGARVVDWISVPLGVATLRDRFADVQDDAGAFALMSWYFEENLADFIPYAGIHQKAGFQIVGTSGTVTTVAASHLGLRRYDRALVDGLVLTSDQIDAVIRDYLRLGPEGRKNDARIGRDRHMLIMPGAAILQALLRLWPTDRLSVADRGLREGLLYAQMSRDGVFPTADSPAGKSGGKGA
ncbi:exopolyphosphatase [Meridianimarinicoccus roseus]|jgi:exopolyphosphatase/guanosine-5'-triphosphate,3'-diphosphate pyrophosphatase|uniref:Exopolyphosphatase n=1 Tax=Meridianimarinicoccus roseus TaxID=2072018 RepID=A0A2V2LEK5_9RHOB|nr:Ppx/GppA phosphatase family protein [Meridianimarinicoccus roseus]PWR04018.1 exopolyphosphatase [Meridianimarinicoccus roseus]